MAQYEYKVVPAPQKGLKGKGIKGPEARFSHALELLMNDMGAEGWEYQRAETLPSIERSGLASSTTEWRNVLVFRRLRETAAEGFAPELLPPPEPPAEAGSDVPEQAAEATSSQEAEGDAKPTESDVSAPEAATDAPVEKDKATAPEEDDPEVDTTGIGASAARLAAFRKSVKSGD